MNATHLTLAVSFGLSLSSLSGAGADARLTQTTTVDSPRLAAHTEHTAPSSLAPSQVTTLLADATKMRVEMAGGFMQADIATRTMTYVNMTTHQSHTQAYDPEIIQDTANRVTGTLSDTGQQKTILGQTAEHYTFTLTSAGWGVTAAGDVWLASNLAQPPLPSLLGGPAGMVAGMLSKLSDPRAHHLTLQMDVRLTGGPSGQMTVKTRTTALSTAALSSATFSLPKDATGHR